LRQTAPHIGKLHSLLNGDRNIADSLRNKLQGDDLQLQLPCHIRMKCPEAEDKLYQIEIVRDDPGRRVKVPYGTEHDE